MVGVLQCYKSVMSECIQGCNIPDIDLVVQWKLPETLLAFVQRAGHAARARDRTRLAVLLAESSAFEVNLDLSVQEKITKKSQRRQKKK